MNQERFGGILATYAKNESNELGILSSLNLIGFSYFNSCGFTCKMRRKFK